MIEVTGLTKYYGPVPAIRDVTFSVGKGEVVGFLGPNGAGKTTTMRILAGFIPATSGRAVVAGFDVFRHSLEVRRRLGYLPENAPLYTDMRVADYLEFVAEVKGLSRGRRLSQVGEMIELCRLEEVEGQLIGTLSKGFRQRVGMAQALLSDPEILILDEPTIGLDPKQIIEIRQLIKDLGGERTVILSTHILPEASMVCQRVIIINEGRIVAVDTPRNLSAKLQQSAQVRLRVQGPSMAIEAELRKVPGVLAVERERHGVDHTFNYVVETTREDEVRPRLAQAVVAKGWGLLELRPADLSLEDIFLRLVTEEREG
jgi:ABC-2 type transport system ATP-binding protein